MKIIVIEDNDHKRKKILDLINNINQDIIIDTANSYNSGLTKCKQNIYDFLILDMSMPTFDKSNDESGGDSRTYGGTEIIRQLKRKGKEIPFILLSQNPKFTNNNQTLSLEEIGEELKILSPNYYKRTVFYNTSSSRWKKEITEEILKYND
jgi:CheY-like chemotaxis protein